jgi:hypothetical protein
MAPTEISFLFRPAEKGDQAAWNAIVEEYAHVLWLVFRSFRFGKAQAADAVQTRPGRGWCSTSPPSGSPSGWRAGSG